MLVDKDVDKEKLLNNEDMIITDEKYEFKSSILKSGEYSYKLLTVKYVDKGVITENFKELLDVKASREYYLDNLKRISLERRRLDNPHKYKVDLSQTLLELKYGLIKKIKGQIS